MTDFFYKEQPKIVTPLFDAAFISVTLFISFIVQDWLLGVYFVFNHLLKYLLLYIPFEKMVPAFKWLFRSWIVIILISPFLSPQTIIVRFFTFMMLEIPTAFFILISYGRINKPDKEPETLEEHIKKDLQIPFVETKEYDFPKPLKWIGGFITPAFPFISILNKNWKQNYTQEARIHENIHLFLLMHKGYILYGLLLVLFNSFLVSLLIKNRIIQEVVLIIFTVGLLVYFEKRTFDLTHEYGKKLNIDTRQWSQKIARKYWFVYLIQISVFSIVMRVIVYLVNVLGGYIWSVLF